MKKLLAHIRQLSFYDTLRHGSVYMLSFLAVQLLMVVSLPVFTKLLTPTDFGIYEVFNNTVRVLAIVLSLNLFNGFYRFYFEEHIDKKALMQFLLRTSLLAFSAGSVLLYIFRDTIMQTLNLPVVLTGWVIVSVFSSIVLNYFNVYNNARQFSTRAGIWQFVQQVLRIGVSVAFVWWIARDYYGRIAGENIAFLVLALVIVLLYFRQYFGWSEQLPDKKEILRYSVSFIPIGLSGFALGYLDTIMINSYEGSNDAGIYSYAYKIAVIYTGITTAFVTANRPKLFDLMNQRQEEAVIAQMLSMFKLVVALSCLFIFFSEEGGKLLALNAEFHAGLHLMPILILSYFFNDLNELYSFYLHYEKKVKYFYYSFTVSAVLNFILNMWLIPRYGYQAAAYTTLISYGFMLMCTYLICKYLLQVRVPAVRRFLDYLLLVAIVMAAQHLIMVRLDGWWWQMAIKSLIFTGVLLYLWRNILSGLLNKNK